jgi:hypothetical protein
LTIDESIIGFVERRIEDGAGWDEGNVGNKRSLAIFGFKQATLQVKGLQRMLRVWHTVQKLQRLS